MKLPEIVHGCAGRVVPHPRVLGLVRHDVLRGLVELSHRRVVVGGPDFRHEVERLVEVLLPQHLEAHEVVVVLPLDEPLREVADAVYARLTREFHSPERKIRIDRIVILLKEKNLRNVHTLASF